MHRKPALLISDADLMNISARLYDVDANNDL
jgi:hypothetical protein